MAHKNNPIDIHLGVKLKEQNLLKRLTLEDFASALNINYQQIHKYEHGLNRLTVAHLCRICQVLNVSFAYFSEDLLPLEPKKENPLTRKNVALLVAFYMQIRDPLKDVFLKMAQTMADNSD